MGERRREGTRKGKRDSEERKGEGDGGERGNVGEQRGEREREREREKKKKRAVETGKIQFGIDRYKININFS